MFAREFCPPAAEPTFSFLSLAKMLSGVNAFDISDIQEAETKGTLTRLSGCNNVALR